MIRKQKLALVGMALLAAVSAVPGRALADEIVTIEREVVAPAMTPDEQAQQRQVNQAAADCESNGGWFDVAAGVCDIGGVK